MIRFLLLFSLLVLNPAICVFAQDRSGEGEDAPTAAVVQEKVRELVKTERLITEAQADWQEEKQRLANLNEVRKREIAQLTELTEAAGDRLKDAAARRDELEAEREELRASREQLLRKIEELEAQARVLLPMLPPVAREKLAGAAERLEAGSVENKSSLQDRYRDVLAVLTEADEFHGTITVATEFRETDAGSREVKVLYLGLSQAFTQTLVEPAREPVGRVRMAGNGRRTRASRRASTRPSPFMKNVRNRPWFVCPSTLPADHFP